MVKGKFTVISGASKDGGTLCPVDGGLVNACFTVEVDESTLPTGYTPAALMVGIDEENDNNGEAL